MKKWYYALEGQSFGPFLEGELFGLARDGVLTPHTLVWNNEPGDADRGWVQASDTELNILFPQMKKWYYAIEGQSFGPFLESELSGLARDGALTPHTLVWNNEPGDADRGWVQASDTELNILFPQMKKWYYALEGQSFGPFLESELSGLARDGALTPHTLVWNNEPSDADGGWAQASDTELNILFPNALQDKLFTQKSVVHDLNSPVIELNIPFKEFVQTSSNVPVSTYIDEPATISKTKRNEKKKTTGFFSKFKDSVNSTKTTSAKQLNTANTILDMGMIQSAILIFLSIAVYFVLRKYLIIQNANSGFISRNLAKTTNFFVQKLVLDPYANLIFGTIIRSLKASVIPVAVYILFLCCSIKFPRIKKISAWIAYIAVAALVGLLFLKSPTLRTFVFSPTTILPWFYGFINISSIAVLFGLYFHSRKLGSGVAFIVLCILNFFVSIVLSGIGLTLDFIPVVNILGKMAISSAHIIISVIEIAHVFMLIAIGNIIKFIIDSCMHKCFGTGSIRN
jgi:hypothetical protein